MSYNEYHFENMYYFFSFYLDFVFVLFSFLHSCTWHSCTLSLVHFHICLNVSMCIRYGAHKPVWVSCSLCHTCDFFSIFVFWVSICDIFDVRIIVVPVIMYVCMAIKTFVI